VSANKQDYTSELVRKANEAMERLAALQKPPTEQEPATEQELPDDSSLDQLRSVGAGSWVSVPVSDLWGAL
jgi:hypothetical protein